MMNDLSPTVSVRLLTSLVAVKSTSASVPVGEYLPESQCLRILRRAASVPIHFPFSTCQGLVLHQSRFET